MADIATIQGGGTPSRSQPSFFGGDLPWVTPSDLAPIGEVTVLGDVAEGLTQEGLRASSAKVLPPGSILFSSRASIGKIAVTDRECATNQGFINLSPDNDRADSWFLAYLLARHREGLIQLAGKTTFLEIPRGKLRGFEVALPPLAEQRRIVARIKACVERVEEVEQLGFRALQEAEHLPRAFRFDMWERCGSRYASVELKSLVMSTKNGLYKPREFHGSGSLLLRLFNINGASFDTGRVERVNVTQKEATDYSIVNGDVIISRVNSRELVGKSTVVHGLAEPAVFEAMLIRLRIDPTKAQANFLAWLMNSPQFLHDLRSRAKHAIGQSSINQQDLLSSRLPMPPLAVQEEIAARFEGLGALGAVLHGDCGTRSQAVRGLRSAILRKAFAGEL